MNKTITLNNGVKIPVVGLGMWDTGSAAETENAVLMAIEAGYRHIDTAKLYGNEKEVGNAIRKSGINRSEIFVTTKLWTSDQGYETTLAAFNKSLSQLNMDYVDLYLIHWPGTLNKRTESWKALEEIYASGKAKAIGVSNYSIPQLEEMKTYLKVVPAVNQVEFHPFLFQKELMEYCHEHHIAMVDYCPLARAKKLMNKTITAIAHKHSHTNAQVILKWALQHGNVVIPKSTNQQRIKENIDVFDFELDKKDMQQLDGLNENYRIV